MTSASEFDPLPGTPNRIELAADRAHAAITRAPLCTNVRATPGSLDIRSLMLTDDNGSLPALLPPCSAKLPHSRRRGRSKP